jgi:hypothetical protein
MHAAHSRESHVASMKTGAFYSQKSSLKQGDGGLRWHSQCSCCTENHENRFLLTHLAPLSPGNSREPWGFAYSRTGMRLIPESRLDRPAHICTPITRDLTSVVRFMGEWNAEYRSTGSGGRTQGGQGAPPP